MQTLDPATEGWFTRERVLTVVLALATLCALYGCYLLIQPFVPALAFAIALAVATQSPYQWLRRKVKRDGAAAALGVVLVALLILGPATSLLAYLVQQAAHNVNELREGSTDWRSAIDRIPYASMALDRIEQQFDLQNQLSSLAKTVAGRATAFLQGSIAFFTQLVITLFVLFFLYRDSEAAQDSLRHMVPLSEREADRMFSRISSTIKATVNGSITVAAVQALLAGLMYVILGVPAPALWGGLTFIMALVPVFGTFLIWGPIALFLLLTGSFIKAAVLVGWGILAIGMIDNILYPYLVGDRLRLHTVPTFFSILGGITVFGPVGLFLGPIILAVTIALLDVWWRRTAHGRAAESAVTANRNTQTSPGEVMQERGAS